MMEVLYALLAGAVALPGVYYRSDEIKDRTNPQYVLSVNRIGLIADNVNMVKLGMAGLDNVAGTVDDYTVRLEYHATCDLANVRVQFATTAPELYGLCTSDNPEVVSAKHYRLKPLPSLPLIVDLNRDRDWEFGAEVALFFDPFESGDTSAWDNMVPATSVSDP